MIQSNSVKSLSLALNKIGETIARHLRDSLIVVTGTSELFITKLRNAERKGYSFRNSRIPLERSLGNVTRTLNVGSLLW